MPEKDKISASDFASKIKSKYPEYKDIDDATLASKMVEKYPEYKDVVYFEPLKKKEPTPSVSSNTPLPSRLPKESSPVLTDLSFKGVSEALPKAAKQVGGEFEMGEAAQSKPSRGIKPIADKSLPNIKEAIDDAVNQYQSKYVFSTDAKDKIEKAYKNGDLVPIKNSKGESKLIRGTGVIESFANAVNKKFEEEATNSYLANAPKQEQIKFLNNKLNNPQEVESAPSGTAAKVSEFVGENAGMLAKGVTAGIGATALALPTGGSSFAQFLSMLPDMAYGGYSGALEKNYIGLKQSNPNISNDEAYEKAHKAALLGEVTGIATNAALAGSISQNILGKVPKPTVEVKGVMDGIINSAKHAIKSYPKVGGVSVAGSVVNDLASNAIGNKVEGDEIGKNALESAKQMAVMHFGLWGLTEPLKIPSYIRPQIENVVASAPREEVQAFYEDGENKGIFPEGTTQKVLSKLSEFDEQKAIVSKMPLAEEQKAAIVGKLLQRKKIEEENSELKKYGASFNDKIEANEKKIEELDAETNNIAKTKDFLKYEKDNLTGRPAKGTPEEISQPIELSIEEPIITEQEIKTPQVEEQAIEVLQPTKTESTPITEVSEVVGESKEGKEFKNRVFEKNVQIGEAPKDAHISEEGYNYRTLSNKEIEAIKESGSVLPREGKQKGGNENTKYWTKGNGENWYGDKESQETIRVRQDKFNEDKPVKAEDLEIYNKETKQFEPLIKETKAEVVEQQPIKEEVKVETPTIEKAKGFTAKEGNKVVDEKGEPLVVYHGTNSEFSEFDKKRIGKGEGSLLGKGYYFTNKLESAKKYGKNVVKAVIKAANVFDLNSYIKNKEYLKDERINQDNVSDLDKFLSNLDYSNFDNYYKAFDEIKLYFKNEKDLDRYDAVKFKSGDYEEVMVRDKDQIKVIKEESTPKEEIKPTDEFISKNGKHKIVYDEKGNIKVVDTKTGEEASSYITKKVINEKADSFDFSKGKKVEEKDLEGQQFRDEEEADRYVVENSENPTQIAEVFVMQKPTGKPLSTIENIIAEFGIGRVTSSSWKRFGDRKVTGMSLAKSYLDGKRARGIDEVAREMSDHYEVEVTPQDIVDFMMRFPNGEGSAFKLTENEVAHSAKERFQELTGLPLNSETAAKAINYEFNKLNEAQRKFAEQQFSTERELEEAYWREHKATNGFTKESPSPEIKPTEAKVKEPTTVADEYEAIKDIKSKKAQENAKKELINNNFESIVSQLMLKNKIKRIC